MKAHFSANEIQNIIANFQNLHLGKNALFGISKKITVKKSIRYFNRTCGCAVPKTTI